MFPNTVLERISGARSMAFRNPTCRWGAEGYSQASFEGATKQKELLLPDFRLSTMIMGLTHIFSTFSTKSEVIPLRLREQIRSVQYDLLSRENHDDTSGSGDQLLEACRLGVLLYVGIIQNEFWVSSTSKHLIWQLKSCLQRGSFASDSTCALRLWLVFLAGSLVLDPTERLWFVYSIVQTVSQLSLPNWWDAKSLLETFAWTGKVQDKSGRDLWDEAMRTESVLRE